MTARYFAYGSNLKRLRMRERVPSARSEGVGRLLGHRLVCDKRGADGSAKANLRPDPTAEVWGAIYRIDASDWASLDAHETGYERLALEVVCCGTAVAVETYRSLLITPDPVPLAWYKRLVVEGAREHALPADWIRTLEAWPARGDPRDPRGAG